jgi:hypothetical protein
MSRRWARVAEGRMTPAQFKSTAASIKPPARSTPPHSIPVYSWLNCPLRARISNYGRGDSGSANTPNTNRASLCVEPEDLR